jgi:hypothetical protein
MPDSFSSGQNRFRNGDGSLNVYCSVCGEFIATTFVRMGNRATCELCRRVENGEELTPEIIDAYNRGKLSRADVTLLRVEEDPPGFKKKKFSLRSLGGEVMEAMGFKRSEKASAGKQSVTIAKVKRRGRLFSETPLDTKPVLGSIETLDKKLSEEPK